MILQAYGVAGLGIAELGLMFQRLGYGYAVVIANRLIKSELSGKKTRVPLIFKGVKAFLATYKKFSGTTPQIAFVIDTPIELSYLNIRTLGTALATKHVYRFTRLDEQMLRSEIEDVPASSVLNVTYTPKKVLAQIVNTSQGGSALAPLQTYLYTIKDKTKRKMVDKAVKTWLTTSVSADKILRPVSRVLPESKLAPILSLMESKKFKRLKMAAIRYKKDSTALPHLLSKYRVSSFDLKYLCAVR